jgi:hypothetical protein
MFYVSRRQGRGRFIHDDQARVADQRFGDLDHLLAGERQIFDPFIRMNVAATNPL